MPSSDGQPDAYARELLAELTGLASSGFTNLFSNAAMVKPGTRRLSDITNWKEELRFLISRYRLAKDYEENFQRPHRRGPFLILSDRKRTLRAHRRPHSTSRTLSAIFSRNRKFLTEFYDALVDWHIELIKIAHDVYHVDMILFHDDMGTQRSTFFSPDLYEELLLPQYQKITKAAHDMGMYICLHSCGCIGTLMPLSSSRPASMPGRDRTAQNDKKAIMETYGKDLAQCTLYIIPAEMSDEDAVAHIHKTVDDLAMTGRFACRLRDNKPDRAVNLTDELYRYSRIKYLEMQK